MWFLPVIALCPLSIVSTSINVGFHALSLRDVASSTCLHNLHVLSHNFSRMWDVEWVGVVVRHRRGENKAEANKKQVSTVERQCDRSDRDCMRLRLRQIWDIMKAARRQSRHKAFSTLLFDFLWLEEEMVGHCHSPSQRESRLKWKRVDLKFLSPLCVCNFSSP